MRSEDMWRPQATKNLARAAYRLKIWPTGRYGMDLKKFRPLDGQLRGRTDHKMPQG
jgi:hypothetical protein